MNTTAIIVAAGRGQRMGDVPKAFMEICGKEMIRYSIEAFERCDRVKNILVVAAGDMAERAARMCHGYPKVGPIVHGGRERRDSVFNGLLIASGAEYVAIHDAARPLVTDGLIERLLDAAEEYGAAIPVLRPTDSIKLGWEFAETGLDRDVVYLAQTPQVFGYRPLVKAYWDAMRKDMSATDDASIAERYGIRTKAVEGDRYNMKVTYPEDIAMAEAIMRSRDG